MTLMSECRHDQGSRLNDGDMWACNGCGSVDLAPFVEVNRFEDGAGISVQWRLANGQVWTAKTFRAPDGERLDPVVPAGYHDDQGAPHANVQEALRLVRLEDTPQNRRLVIAMLRRSLESDGVELIVQ